MSTDDITPTSRGHSFSGRALEGADFSGADVRGADFTNADLRSASFRDARFGSVPWIRAAILSTAIAAAVGAGVLIGLAVEGTNERLSSDDFDEVVVAAVVIVTLIVLVGIVLYRGFDPALKVAAVVYLALVAGTILANLIWEDVEWQAVLRATLVVWAFVFGIWAGVISHLTVGFFGRWAVAAMTVLGAFASGRVEGGLAGIVLSLSVSHFSNRAVHGDARDDRLLTLARHLVRRWGTRFVDADLTDTDFRGVDISKCDVTGATLAGAQWDPGQMPSGEVDNDTP
jgi:uncharacterized protein YjbI with pentapeptide repeats